jgi:exopolyphosphatase/pppGpp-phosphohydrolase
VSGEEPWHLVVVERGGPVATSPATLERHAAEDVFRLLATETRAQRLANPGLDPDRVDTVVATCCVVLAVMRRLHLDRVIVAGPSVQAG